MVTGKLHPPTVGGIGFISRMGEVWQLRHGNELLAELIVTARDFPWLNATLHATDAFPPWRGAFDDELRLLDDIDGHVEQWEDAYRRIGQHLTLHFPTGARVAEFLLHIDGDAAWWRWSDEPFPPDPTQPKPGLRTLPAHRRGTGSVPAGTV